MKVMHLASHRDYLATRMGLSLPVRTVCGVRLKAGEGAPRNAPMCSACVKRAGWPNANGTRG